MNMTAVKKLKQLYINNHRVTHPNIPEYARCAPSYSDRTANGLTKCIIDFLRLKGYQAERISVTGRKISQSKVYTDVLGATRKIGQDKWIKTSMQKGTADISAIINGRSVKIEVKIGRDRQSQSQKKYQDEVERSGGVYWIVRSFDDFIAKYKDLTTSINEMP